MNAELQNELNVLLHKLDGLKDIPRREQTRALTEAAGPLRAAIAGKAPQSDRPHKRYSTAKVSKKIRAPRGRGNVVAVYNPGNLRQSIQTLRFRRSKAIFIGPKLDKSRSGRLPDGYYAHFVEFGTAQGQPAQHFVKTAVGAFGNTALRLAAEVIRRKIETYAAQNGLK